MNEFITQAELNEFAEAFRQDSTNLLAMNTVCSNGVNASARSFTASRKTSHVYSVSLPQHGITWQRNSGRCWMFSGFNILRDRVIETLGLEEFSFSGNYLMFYDKLEKANLFLENVLKYIDQPTDSRIVMSLMKGVRGDGGEWEMFVSLVQKYGLVPQSAQPETISTNDSRSMPHIVQEKLREFGRELREAYQAGESVEALRGRKEEMLSTIYRMYAIAYGEPVKTFDFKVRSKDGTYICDRGITPQEFYHKYVGVDLNNYVNLTAGSSNGRERKKYGYPDVGNVVGGKPICYVSVDMDTLRKATIAQLQDGEPVWFGCDVGERSWRDSGVLDDEIYGFEQLFDIHFGMSKEERFHYGQAHMSHAMTFKGVDLDENGQPLTWRVENSWGPEPGDKGMFTMTDSWFEKYNYQVIIHRKHLSEDILRVFDGEDMIALDKWQKNI